MLSYANNDTDRIILLKNSLFQNNFLFYFDENQEAGGAVYLNSDRNMVIEDCLFQNNSINSSNRYPKNRISSPCLLSLSILNIIDIKNSVFEDNHSRFSSNCLTFYGLSLEVTNSSFSNNIAIFDISIIEAFMSGLTNFPDIAQLNPELGGALDFEGLNLIVNRSFFNGNTGFKGGAIFLNKYYFEFEQKVIIVESYFKENRAFNGAAIGFFDSLKAINAIILDCIISSNFGGAISVAYRYPTCYAFVKSSYGFNNTGFFGGVFEIINLNSLFSINDCFFEGNNGLDYKLQAGGGAVFALEGDSTTIVNTSNNLCFNNGLAITGIVAMFGGVNNDQNSSYIGNRNVEAGGAIYLISFASGYYYNTKFIWNYANSLAGAVILNSGCYALMKNVFVLGCSSERGGVFTVVERSSLNIINCTFRNNSAGSGGILISLENYDSIMTIINSTFESNQGDDNLFNMLNTHLIADNCLFVNNINTIFSLTVSTLTLENVHIADHNCINQMIGCAISLTENSSILSNNFFMISINNLNEEGNIYLESSKGVFTSSFFQNLTNLKSLGSCFDLQSSYLIVDNGSFSNYDYNCFFAINSTIIINNSIFDNNDSIFTHKNDFSIKYGTVLCTSCRNLYAYNSFFSNNKASDYGGTFYIVSNTEDYNFNMFLLNVSFIGNKVLQSGGVLYLKGVNGNIVNCLFKRNTANYGAGIYFESTYTNPKELILSGNKFENNQAILEGGVIKWNDVEPIIYNNNSFINNTAKYGDINAAFPFRIEMEYLPNREIICYNGSDNCYISLKDISSGSLLNFSLVFSIKDIYNKTSSSVNEGLIVLDFITNDNMDSSFKAIEGAKSLTISEGKVYFSSLKIFSKPDSEVFFAISTTKITRFYSEFFVSEKNFSDNSDNLKYSYVFSIKFRNCIIGEVYIEQINSCSMCTFGKYSLTDPMKAKSCLTCPSSAVCNGGSSISLKRGFWRASNKTDIIVDCDKFADFCLGEENSLCEVGCSGPICGDCIKGYSKISDFCVICLDKSTNIFRIIAFLFLYALILILYAWFSLKESEKMLQKLESQKYFSPKSKISLDPVKSLSIYIKIWINYSQMILIIQNINLKWPYYVGNYMKVNGNMGNISTQILSLDCLISDYNLNINAVYLKSITTIIIYVFILSGSGVFFLINKFIFRRNNQFNKYIILIIVLSIMIQPNSIKETSDILICQSVLDKNYLSQEMSVQCYTKSHYEWIFTFAMPMLFFWILFYPLICLAYMICNRTKRETVQFQIKMGYYINGYEKDLYFWEFIIMYRKMIFIFFPMFAPLKTQENTAILLFFSSVSLLLTLKYKPFIFKTMNVLEVYSNMTALITIFSGSLYVLDINDNSKAIIFILIVLVNTNFALKWLFSVLDFALKTYEKQILRFCPFVLSLSKNSFHCLSFKKKPLKTNHQ